MGYGARAPRRYYMRDVTSTHTLVNRLGIPARSSGRARDPLEIRFHGRGGMGAVVASELLAQAAFFEGLWAQSFPFFGVERRGAPVSAFARIADAPLEVRTNVYEPDIVVILDPSLLRGSAFLEGLKDDGTVVANASTDRVLWNRPAYVVDATEIALDEGLGSRSMPIVNTAMVGALAGATGLVRLPSVLQSIEALVPQKVEANRRAAERAFRAVRRVAAPEVKA